MAIVNIIYSIFSTLFVVLAGYICKGAAESNVNNYIGYRTSLAKKNQDTWKEANLYVGNIFIKLGMAYLVISLILSIIFFKNPETILPVLIFIYPLIIFVGIYISEKHLKNIFDKDGNRLA